MSHPAVVRWKNEQFRVHKTRPCRYCGKMLTLATATVDHKKPKSLGGRNKPKNFALACKTCNEKKGSKYHDTKRPHIDPYAPDPWWPTKKAEDRV